MTNTPCPGSEPFTFVGVPKKFTLGDFWKWYATYLMNNITRGHLAEFIVANALGIATNGPLPEWESHDLVFQGKRIEIKASAYIQEWNQAVNTNPRFSIRPARTWSSKGGYGNTAQRNSDMYIFCVLTEMDRSAVNPLALDKWEFYPVLTSKLDAMLGAQKSIGMATICRLCPEPPDYAGLREAVTRIFLNEKPRRLLTTH